MRHTFKYIYKYKRCLYTKVGALDVTLKIKFISTSPCLTVPAGAFDEWPKLPTTLPTSGTRYLAGFERGDFTGSIPTQYGQLTEITAIDLRENSLSAAIPTELGKLKSVCVHARVRRPCLWRCLYVSSSEPTGGGP